MMIVGGPHALRGRHATLHQFCNDWVSVDLPASGDLPALYRSFRVTQVMLTAEEAARMRDAGDRAGTMWREFELVEQPNGMFRIMPRRGRHREGQGE